MGMMITNDMDLYKSTFKELSINSTFKQTFGQFNTELMRPWSHFWGCLKGQLITVECNSYYYEMVC